MTSVDEKTKKIPDQILIVTEKLGSVREVVVSDIVSFLQYPYGQFLSCLSWRKSLWIYITVMSLFMETLHYFISLYFLPLFFYDSLLYVC